MTKQPAISVIFTTYNQPEWLHKVLIGFCYQTFTDFEVLVADDGSREETRAVVDLMKARAPYSIQHIWHPDEGYQKCQILNKAIRASRAEYLVFTDGDCIPRADFLQAHWEHKAPNRFLSGGLTRLPLGISKAITEEDIATGRCFNVSYLNQLVAGERVPSAKKLIQNKLLTHLLNTFTTARASWNGSNASTYKAHILAVNGMDERMQYGGQDRELGERLTNLGIKGKQVRYKAILLHLDHKRGYMTDEGWALNNGIRQETRRQHSTWTEYGLEQQKEPIEALVTASRHLSNSNK